jgi:MarR family transcriptional regulator, organic hydroperoxide resistance regulator
MYEAIGGYDITPIQATLLIYFEPDQQYSMQYLSKAMGCDASNITGLIDRLEQQEYLARTVNPDDRRIKCISLTQKGKECRSTILGRLAESEAIDLERLSDADKATFARIIDALLSQD